MDGVRNDVDDTQHCQKRRLQVRDNVTLNGTRTYQHEEVPQSALIKLEEQSPAVRSDIPWAFVLGEPYDERNEEQTCAVP